MSDSRLRTIWNCPALQLPVLSYQCPQVWWALGETENPKVRFCSECKKHVHLCETPQEFISAAEQGHCVGIPLEKRPIELLACLVGQPSAEFAARFRDQVRSVVNWWGDVIERVPQALGNELEPTLTRVERARDRHAADESTE